MGLDPEATVHATVPTQNYLNYERNVSERYILLQ